MAVMNKVLVAAPSNIERLVLPLEKFSYLPATLLGPSHSCCHVVMDAAGSWLNQLAASPTSVNLKAFILINSRVAVSDAVASQISRNLVRWSSGNSVVL